MGGVTIPILSCSIQEILSYFSQISHESTLSALLELMTFSILSWTLRKPLPIQSLSIRLLGPGFDLVLSEDLFGGKVSIRHLQFASAYCRIVAPCWLLRGVTHFTVTEPLLSKLVGNLHQMSALICLEINLGYIYPWEKSDLDEWRISRVPLPHLEILIVRLLSPCFFLQLNQILSLPAGVKKQVELGAGGELYDWVLR